MPAIVIVIDELADLMMSGNKKEVEKFYCSYCTDGTSCRNALNRCNSTTVSRCHHRTYQGKHTKSYSIYSRIAGRLTYYIRSCWCWGSPRQRWYALCSEWGYGTWACSGRFLKTEEVEAVVNFIKLHTDAETAANMYDMTIIGGQKHDGPWDINGDGSADEEDDFIIQQAIEVVRSSWKTSTSLLQRRLKLWYARAARVMDALGEMGVIWPADGSKPREVY